MKNEASLRSVRDVEDAVPYNCHPGILRTRVGVTPTPTINFHNYGTSAPHNLGMLARTLSPTIVIRHFANKGRCGTDPYNIFL